MVPCSGWATYRAQGFVRPRIAISRGDRELASTSPRTLLKDAMALESGAIWQRSGPRMRHVLDIRSFGLAAGLTIAAYPGEPTRRPYEIAMRCWKKGFYVRFGGDTIQLAPPFIARPEEIDSLVNALGDALNEEP
jgi:adenosylmethionine-8-amino-7-oxononanoate aminotransferase